MSTEENQNEIELKAFEAALASLVPRADRLDRDRLMFLAGQQSRPGFQPVKRFWAWPTACSAMTCVSMVLAILLAIRSPIPSAGSGQSAIAANMPKDQQAASSVFQTQDIPNHPATLKNNFHNPQKPSAWAAFLQTMWTLPSTENPATANQLVSDSSPQYYPQLRDRILRNGLDSLQVAQYSGSISNNRNTEPSTYRELLKEYLPEMK